MAEAYQNYVAPEVATGSMNKPTAAQIAAAKKAIGGLGIRDYAAAPQYTLPAAPYSGDEDQNVAPMRDMFYQQFTQPGTFAAPVPRLTAPDAQGTNPFLQNIQQAMQLSQARQFFPLYNPQQSMPSAPQLGTMPYSRALAGNRLAGILSAGAARGLI